MRAGLLVRHRDFRLLWLGETAGKFGAAVTSVAMPLVALSAADASTFEIGLLSASAWLPWLLVGLPAGAWVDRVRRRPVMLAAAAASAALFAAVPAAVRLGVVSVGLLVAVALLAGTAAVFFQTAYTAFLPSILAPEDQPEGNAKLHGSAAAAQIAGQGAAGLLAQAAGVVNAMFVNASTFVLSVLCLARMRHEEPRTAPAARKALTAEVADGLRLVVRDPWLRTLTLFGATSNVALMGYQAIQVVFLVETVGVGPGTVGLVVAVAGGGGVAGAAVARWVADRAGTARAMLVFELGMASPALLIPLTFAGPGLALCAAGGFCVSAGVVAGNVVKASFQQHYCPPELLGRLTASTAFLNLGAIPVGALLGGTLGTVLGLRAAMWVACAGVPAAALILLFSPVGRTRSLPVSPAAALPVGPRTSAT